MSAEKIRRQLQEIRDKLKPPARPVFACGIVEGGELIAITVTGTEYQRRPGEDEGEFQRRVRIEVGAKPLVVFSQASDPSPPFVSG